MKALYRGTAIGIAVISIGILLLASAAHDKSVAAGSGSDKDYRDKLVGTWTENGVGPAATLQRTLSFSADGTYRSTAKLTKPEKMINYQNRGTWSVENGIIYITVLESTRADIPLGRKTANKIVSLTETEAVTESAEGIRTKAYRTK